jgi:hypothetical protein
MHYQIVLPERMAKELPTHLLTDRSREQMAIVLCGKHESSTGIRLLGRHSVLMPPEAFAHQSAGGLTLRPEVQQRVLQMAAWEGLDQVDFHSHPGDGPHVGFSGTDDRNEQALAQYLAERLPGTHYASVVVNASSMAARIWQVSGDEIRPRTIPAPPWDGSVWPVNGDGDLAPSDLARFDRQISAFGRAFQQRLRALRVGIVGLGGIGAVVAEQLARLGVRAFVLVDHDVVEVSNLNRLLGATLKDAREEISKVKVAARTIKRIDADAEVISLRCTVFTERALRALSTCNVLMAATDNDASRFTLNALAAQYLIPIVHVGVNLGVQPDGRFDDISGEVVVPPVGSWCLLCAGIVDANRVVQDLARPEERMLLRERGYIPGVPAPAVYHLNATIASIAVAELHNVIAPYRPQRRYLVYRELEGELMNVNVPRTEDCLHCSPEGRLGLGDLAPLWRPERHMAALPEANNPDGSDGGFDESGTELFDDPRA